jgi:hypothetical protein
VPHPAGSPFGGLGGGRDHTTVINADRKIRSLMAERRSIYTQVTEITNPHQAAGAHGLIRAARDMRTVCGQHCDV